MRHFTRLTNAFSKKVEKHAAAIALHTMYYNFVRIHRTLKVAPAMAAGVSKKLWEVSDIVEMLEQWELANLKPEYNFVVRQYMIGKGHSISVRGRGGEVIRSRIQLSDKTSRLHPRHVVPKPAQAYDSDLKPNTMRWNGSGRSRKAG
jgi:hypothetical protein